MKIRKTAIRKYLLCFAIIVSVLSQIEAIEGLARPAMYGSWLFVLGYALAERKGKLVFSPFAKSFVICYALFSVLCLLSGLFDGAHLQSNYLKVLLVPLLVTLVGGVYVEADAAELQLYLVVYIACAFVYAVWVNITYFSSYTVWLTQQVYAFVSKNSAAQIWSTAMLLLIFYVRYQNTFWKLIGYGCAGYFLIISGISQCRTALLATAVVAAVYALVKAKRKWLVAALLIVAAAAVWNIPVTHDFIEQALFLNKYKNADMNTFSSGRLDLWAKALERFYESPVVGVGKYYVDCSYLSILAESGGIGFLLIENIWLKRIALNFRVRETRESTLIFCLTVFYMVESLLEGYPPFGPGVSAFVFWLLSAIFDRTKCTCKNISG